MIQRAIFLAIVCWTMMSCASEGTSGPLDSSASDTDSDTDTTTDTGTDAQPECPFPTSFTWEDNGGPLAQPKNEWVSLKDFTSTGYNGQIIVYSTYHDGSNYGSQMMIFDDWASMDLVDQSKMSKATVAPTLTYFAPKDLWVLAYQWCSARFCYMTSSDPSDVSSWSTEKPLLTEDIATADGAAYGPIDQEVICDDTTCYLFYNGDNGHVYRASMPIGDFPGKFSGSQSILNDVVYFEAVQVYTVKGTGKYLMIVENNKNPRSFTALSADDLGGEWTQIGDFASQDNTTFNDLWTHDISHGDLFRENPDQTHTVDPCKLQFLYQGRDPNAVSSYDERPYRPGLLTMTQ